MSIFSGEDQTGIPYVGKELPVNLPVQSGKIQKFWIDIGYYPFKNEHGKIIGIFALVYDVTGQIEARNSLQESQEHLKLALEAGRVGTWKLDLETQQLIGSPEHSAILGIDHSVHDIFSLADRLVHPDDQEYVHRVWTEAAKNGTPFSLEYRINRLDGETRWVEVHGETKFDARGEKTFFMGVMADITARKRAEKELKWATSIFNAIMTTSSDIIYVKDRRSRMVYCNPMTLKLGGFTESDCYGKNDIEFLGAGNGGEEILRTDERIMSSGKGETKEEWVTWPDGAKLLYLSRKEPRFDSMGNVIGLIGISSDITVRKAAENQVQLTLSDLVQERDLREKFVATLTHDLRTPLTAAKMSAQILVRQANSVDAVQKGSLRIANCIDRADRMIRDLLDANRIRAGEKLPLQLEACEIQSVLTEVLEDLATIHGDRFVIQAPVAIRGFWSKSEVRRILENLCGNAVKYGAPYKPITVTVSLAHPNVEIRVHNLGAPIEPEDQKMLFEPFRRTDSALSGGQKGWGLGLALVKGFAEAHGGSVSVGSDRLSGTTFLVLLPLDGRAVSGNEL